MKGSIKEYNTVIVTSDIDERNRIVTELYWKGMEYWYTGLQKDGTYKVGYDL